MRAIIIADKDARALMDKLELERIKASGNQVSLHGDPVDDAHGVFVYVVVQWLHDQGCDLVRRS